ncbi:hypothetical protein C8R44DRAFT_874397 [Mycena epipterygia]|nr:hypothetical protein C8R44DRAFT_874397 [Mycena epipterygia]
MSSPYSPALDGSLGALEIGAVAGTFLFGILTLQTFNYYRQFPGDSKYLKLTIAILWLFELAHTICLQQGIYEMTVTFYGQPSSQIILNPPQSHIVAMFFNGAIDAMVQIFFGNRIRVLSGRLHVFFLCIVLAILRFACNILVMSSFWIYDMGYAALQSKVHWEVVAACTLGPAGDVLVAVAMCYYLWRRRNSILNQTRNTVDTLMLWTFETTLLTSVSTIIQLVLFLVGTDLTFMAFYLIQPKLFSNSMLAVLNGRTRFHTDEVVSSPSLPFEAVGPKSPRGPERRSLHPGAIHILSSSEVHDDRDDVSSFVCSVAS